MEWVSESMLRLEGFMRFGLALKVVHMSLGSDPSTYEIYVKVLLVLLSLMRRWETFTEREICENLEAMRKLFYFSRGPNTISVVCKLQ